VKNYTLEATALLDDLKIRGQWRTVLLKYAARKDRDLKIIDMCLIGHTYTEIGKRLGLTKTRVMQIYNRETN
jgi:hypothetical protein